MHQLRSLFKRWFNGLYVVAFIFIVIGIVLLLLPALRGTVWQTIGGALLGAGFTILVTTITAGQSILEQYKKEANLQRKANVYGPLHAELKELREIFDKAYAGIEPYPWRIDIEGEQSRPSMFQRTYIPPTFSYWPTFRKDYRVDDFTHIAQKLLDDVQSHIRTYNEVVETARKATQAILRQHIATSIDKEAQRPEYQDWQRKRHEPPLIQHRWFEFIDLQISTSTLDIPLGEYLSQSWTRTIGWFLADKPDQAAQAIYRSDAINWGAPDLVSLSWFQDIFQAVWTELKSDPTYQHVMLTQEKLFQRLQEAEKALEEGLRYIRDRYEGGIPPV